MIFLLSFGFWNGRPFQQIFGKEGNCAARPSQKEKHFLSENWRKAKREGAVSAFWLKSQCLEFKMKSLGVLFIYTQLKSAPKPCFKILFLNPAMEQVNKTFLFPTDFSLVLLKQACGLILFPSDILSICISAGTLSLWSCHLVVSWLRTQGTLA